VADCLVNIDFEHCLGNDNYKPIKKVNSEFEYLFFFMRRKTEESLLSSSQYSDSYFEYLKTLEIEIPLLKNKSNDIELWWGSRTQLELKRQVSSKTFAMDMAKKIKLLPKKSSIVSSFEEIESFYEKHGELLLRSNHNFSGRGHLFVHDLEHNEKQIKKKIQEGRLACDVIRKRVLDIGVSIDLKAEEYFIVQNYNDELGSFKGGRFFENIDDLKKTYSFVDDLELEESILKIIAELKSLNCTGPIQVDMYYFEEEDEIKLNALVEINWRKTMGMMIRALSRFDKEGAGSWFLIPRKKVKEDISYHDISSCCDDEVILTSPFNKMFFTFYLRGNFKEKQLASLSNLLKYLEVKESDFYLNCL